jgi:hypothetical protein
MAMKRRHRSRVRKAIPPASAFDDKRRQKRSVKRDARQKGDRFIFFRQKGDRFIFFRK